MTEAVTIRPVGDRGVIIELPSLERVLEVAAAVRLRRTAGLLGGVIDVVPASRTVLLICESRSAAREAARVLHEFSVSGSGASARGRRVASREVVLDVIYDGADLQRVATQVGLSPEAVVAAHTRTAWSAAFGGFAPGFAYLVGGDPRLRVPRLDSPRTAVPAGSVALAGEFSAVYPSASPGGWQLIGRTLGQVWDVAREQPALITPGDTVRFRAVRERVAAAGGSEPGPAQPVPAELPARPGRAHPVPATPSAARRSESPGLVILRPGMLALLQDDGRPGSAAIGVTASGAADRGALRRANLAVGNTPGAVAIELLNGGLVVEAVRSLTLALAGAEAEATITETDSAKHRAPWGAAFTLAAGARLSMGAPACGLRSVLAVRGGIAAERILGSASRDTLSGLGPPPLVAGDELALAAETAVASISLAAAEATEAVESGHARAGVTPVLRYVPGPRDDWFTAESQAALGEASWSVSAQSNRVGLRLEGAMLRRSTHGGEPQRRPAELPSEGMVCGSIQVPPNGQPVLFLADHPTTGGYPVIGTVIDDDLDRAAQLAPGAEVRFAAVDPDDIGQPRGLKPPRQRDTPSEVPARVEVVLEVDGRRRVVAIPGEIARALDLAAAAGDRTPVEQLLRELVAVFTEGDARGGEGPIPA